MAPTLLATRVMFIAVLTSLVAMNEPALACPQRDELVASAAPVERTVTVHVRPWADVYVDGALVARTAKRAHISLPVGEHVVVFRNPAALDEARTVVVPSTGTIPRVVVELARKPAQLQVTTNVPDADVDVCARGVAERPMHVMVTDSRATVLVRVSRRGFATVTRRVEVEAGRVVRVDVQLAPDD